MNTVGRLYRAVRSPKRFARHANRLYHRRPNRRRYDPAGVDVFAEE